MDFWGEGLWRSFILVATIVLHLPNYSRATSYYEAPLHYRQHALNATDLPCGSDLEVKAGEKFLFDSASAIVYESSQYASSSYTSTRRKRASNQEQKPKANLNTQDGPTSMKFSILQERTSQASGRSYGSGGSTSGGHSHSSSGSGGAIYKGSGHGGETHYGGGGGGGYGHSIKPSVCQWTYFASNDCSLEMHIIRFKPGDLNCYKQEFSVSDNHTEFKLCGHRKLYPGFRAETPVLYIKYWRLPYTYRHVFKGYVTCVGRAQNPTFDDSAQYYLPADPKENWEEKAVEVHKNADTKGISHAVNQFILEQGLSIKKPSNDVRTHAGQQATFQESTTTEDPGESTTTEDPGESTTTEDPGESTTTEEPAQSTTTAEPGESTTTEDPAQSTTTAEPAESTTTAEPAESTTTAEPAESTTTAEPGESTTTEDPGISTSTTDSATNSLNVKVSATKGASSEEASSEEASSEESSSEEYAAKGPQNQYGEYKDLYEQEGEPEVTLVEKKVFIKNHRHEQSAQETVNGIENTEGDHKTVADLIKHFAPESKSAAVAEEDVNTNDNAEEGTTEKTKVEENVTEETVDSEIKEKEPEAEVTFASQNLSPAGRSYEDNPVDPYSYNVPQSGMSPYANPFLAPQSQYYGYQYPRVIYIPVPSETYPYYGQMFEGSIDQNPSPASPSAYPYTIPHIEAPSPSYSYVGRNFPPPGPLSGAGDTAYGYNVQQPLSLNYNPVVPPYIQNVPADLPPYPQLEPPYPYQPPPPRQSPQGPLPVPPPNGPSYSYELPQTFRQPQPPPYQFHTDNQYGSIAPEFPTDQNRGYGMPPIEGPLSPSYTYASPSADGPLLIPDYNSRSYGEEDSYHQPYPPQANYPIAYPVEYQSHPPPPPPPPHYPIQYPVPPSPPQLTGYDYMMSSATDPNAKYVVTCDRPYPQPCTPLSITPINGQLQHQQTQSSSAYNYQPKQQPVMYGR